MAQDRIVYPSRVQVKPDKFGKDGVLFYSAMVFEAPVQKQESRTSEWTNAGVLKY